MYSWSEHVSSHIVYLNLRYEYKFLYSKTLDKIIQTEFNDKFNTLIKLRIEKKTSNFSKKTPMELIYRLYEKQISKLKQEFLINPDCVLMRSFFDIEFNEVDINIF